MQATFFGRDRKTSPMPMNRSTTQDKAESWTNQQGEADVPPLKVHKPAPVESEPSTFILCCYQNQKSVMQVVRSTSHEIPKWHLERVVFPGQRLMFHAPPQAKLKVYNANTAGNLLSDTVPCDRLEVDEGSLFRALRPNIFLHPAKSRDTLVAVSAFLSPFRAKCLTVGLPQAIAAAQIRVAVCQLMPYSRGTRRTRVGRVERSETQHQHQHRFCRYTLAL